MRLAPIAAVAILLASACGGEQNPATGDALATGARSVYSVTGVGALPPGEEVSLMLTPLRNISGGDVVVQRIEPLGVAVEAGGESPAEVVAIELAARDGELALAVPLGFYPGPRPAIEVDGTCVEQPTLAADGFVLEPEEEAAEEVFLVLVVRTRAPGTFTLEGQRVVYEAGGTVYRQDFLAGLELEVREDAEPDLPEDQAACVAR